jgi:hypothetical protein
MRWIGTELEEPDFVLAMKAFTRGSQWQADQLWCCMGLLPKSIVKRCETDHLKQALQLEDDYSLEPKIVKLQLHA